MLDLAHTKRLGHTMVVSVDDVACDRCVDKRVCDRLSEIFANANGVPPARVPTERGPQSRFSFKVLEDVQAHGCRDGD